MSYTLRKFNSNHITMTSEQRKSSDGVRQTYRKKKKSHYNHFPPIVYYQ